MQREGKELEPLEIDPNAPEIPGPAQKPEYGKNKDMTIDFAQEKPTDNTDMNIDFGQEKEEPELTYRYMVCKRRLLILTTR